MRSSDRGYAMAALLVALSVMSIMLGVALPVWNTAARREREAELIFRGEQYARAVELFQRRNPGVFPPNLDLLVDGKFLRKKYTDPITGGEFQLLYAGQLQAGQVGLGGQRGQGGRVGQTGQAGAEASLTELQRQIGTVQGRGVPATPIAVGPGLQGGILGVASRSTAESLRVYNGRGRYNEWTFVATPATVQAGAGARGGQAPGVPVRGGRRGDPAAPPGRGGRAAPDGRRGFPQPVFPGLQLPGRGRQ